MAKRKGGKKKGGRKPLRTQLVCIQISTGPGVTRTKKDLPGAPGVGCWDCRDVHPHPTTLFLKAICCQHGIPKEMLPIFNHLNKPFK